jgi:hypothetical protein
LLLEAEGEDESAEPRKYRSDVAVIESRAPVESSPVNGGSAVATVEPVVIRRFDGPVIDRWIQIVT